MYSVGNNYDWEAQSRQAVVESRAILQRTGESLQRSNQIAIETENMGTEVVSELSSQRETLLRAKDRLTTADEHLNSARNILKKMGRSLLYNKFILVLIILLEIGILVSVSYLKFVKK